MDPKYHFTKKNEFCWFWVEMWHRHVLWDSLMRVMAFLRIFIDVKNNQKCVNIRFYFPTASFCLILGLLSLSPGETWSALFNGVTLRTIIIVNTVINRFCILREELSFKDEAANSGMLGWLIQTLSLSLALSLLVSLCVFVTVSACVSSRLMAWCISVSRSVPSSWGLYGDRATR